MLGGMGINLSKTEKAKETSENETFRFLTKYIDFFKRKAEQVHNSRLHNTGRFSQKVTAGLTAPYEVARKIAVVKKIIQLENS